MSMKRAVVLQGLPHYLSEDPSDFFKSAEVDLHVNIIPLLKIMFCICLIRTLSVKSFIVS